VYDCEDNLGDKPMPIIAILNPKGGSGKTTLSTNLARALQLKGFRVLLVDSDPQGSARDWHAAREVNPLPLIALDRANNFQNLPSIASGYDFTVIDGAAKLEDLIAAAIKTADMILIPVQPSPYDLWAASDLVDIIKTRQQITEGRPKSAFVINRTIQGTKLGREIVDVLNGYDLPAFSASTMQRQIYPQTAAEGLTVFDGGNTDAIKEIECVCNELLKYLNIEIRKNTNEAINKTA
jgi:chromosome partitioning protein